MFKGRSASMQRGARERDWEPLTQADVALFKKTRISSQELAHFNFGHRTKEATLDELEPMLRSYATNGFRAPKDVARLLNKSGMKTACGEPWTPQLAWFLLGFLFERREKRRLEKAKEALRPRVRAPAAPGSSARSPLTAEEIARRLSALGKVTSPR